ncbi:MAG: NAD(+)/NADH kinase [Brevinema sp.]
MTTALITGKTNTPHLAPLFQLLQEELAILGINSFIVPPNNILPSNRPFHIVFSIGGDGSFVGAVRKYIRYAIPIIPVKGGTVGFLANLEPKSFKRSLPKLFSPKNKWTRRMVLSGIKNDGQKLIALNEFLFSNKRKGILTEFVVYINNKQVMKVRADGILIASPTGSTAYNLSAGGPISLPDMELITITPICSHILGERPLVIGLNNKICITNPSSPNSEVWADGQEVLPFENGDTFTIMKPLYVNSLYTPSHEFFSSLSRKLGWRLGTTNTKSQDFLC